MYVLRCYRNMVKSRMADARVIGYICVRNKTTSPCYVWRNSLMWYLYCVSVHEWTKKKISYGNVLVFKHDEL